MDMLQSNTTIKQLRIDCFSNTRDSLFSRQSVHNWREIMQSFYETVFIHPSIEYIEIISSDKAVLNDFLKKHKRLLLSKHEQEQPHRQIPIVTHLNRPY